MMAYKMVLETDVDLHQPITLQCYSYRDCHGFEVC